VAVHGLVEATPSFPADEGDCLTFYSGVVACLGDGGSRTARLRGLNEQFEVAAAYSAYALEASPGAPATRGIWQRR
jgi:hypothetical protein